MATINEWYGENNINWGKSYSQSWWGSVNEANSWGILYPGTAEGSIIYADTTSYTADATGITSDNGVGGVVTPPATPGTATDTTWWTAYSVETTQSGVLYFQFTYNSVTYGRGVVGTQAEYTDYAGETVVGGSEVSRTLRIDTETPDVGTFIFDVYGEAVNENDSYTYAMLFGPYAYYSQPRYIFIGTINSYVSGGVFNPYPLFKLEQVNGYLQITEKIEAP